MIDQHFNRRLLVVDDNHAIHDDFRKIFRVNEAVATLDALDALEASLFGAAPQLAPTRAFSIDSAHQGQEAYELVRRAMEMGQPYALAFVDMRLPPGWDGLETIEHLWQVDPLLQIVICSAYADYSWGDIAGRLRPSDRLLILKKPFDTIEVIQLAHTLTRKWTLHREAQAQLQSLEERNVELETTVRKRTTELVSAHEQAARAERMRLENELRIAAHIQTSLLPATTDVTGLEIAATMQPASEVGGDYYDIISVADGAWIGIGDVAGHGLTSGLVMLMVQSTIASIAHVDPHIGPREAICAVNHVIYENVRNRLHLDEHVTLTLLRYTHDGKVVFAGAHEELVVVRAATGKAEILETPGTWVGGMPDVAPATVETECQLEVGDTLLLYTDGVTEAMNSDRVQFGIDRLTEIAEATFKSGPAAMHDEIMKSVASFTKSQVDDITVVVMRYVGV